MSRNDLFRARSGHGHAPVTNIELFFDLVFVFAITQLSHALLEHLSWLGGLQILLLLFAVWWVWIFTTWVANWLDPDRANVRLMLIALMMGDSCCRAQFLRRSARTAGCSPRPIARCRSGEHST